MENIKVRLNNEDDFKFCFWNFPCCSCFFFFIMAGLTMISLLFTRDYNNPTVTKTFRYFTADKVLVTFFFSHLRSQAVFFSSC